jgi:scyllo-inositol 2-dehydrogenase (NADP+)
LPASGTRPGNVMLPGRGLPDNTYHGMAKLNVGIVGFGRIGNEHAQWLRACKGASPAAIADPTPARQKKASASGLKVYDTIDDLLTDSTIDAVLIATPTAMHAEQALAALAAGKHVMVEKPIALDLGQTRRIMDAASAAKLIVSVFHNRRWDIDYLTVKHAIVSGIFGRVFNVESRLGQWASCVGPAAKEWRPGWRNEAAFGGGGLYDWGSHFVDQLWRLFWPAKPLRVFAQLRANVWTSDCDDFARVLIDFDNGAAGLVEINTTTTRPLPRWHLDGTAGSAQSPPSPKFDLKTWAQLSFTPADENEAGQTIPLAKPGLTEIQIWDNFVAAIRGEGPPAVSIASVIPTMALLDAARQSSQTGQAVAIDPKLSLVF